MISPDLISEMEAAGPGKRHGLMLVCLLLILAGAVAFLLGAAGNHPERAWQSYLINFIFWIGLAFGAVMFSALLTITGAAWGRPIKRLAESLSAFLPVACVLFWVLYLGRGHIFHWMDHPPEEKAAWLNVDFLFLRDSGAMILLTVLGLAIVYHSLRRDLKGTGRGEVHRGSGEGDRHPGSEKTLSILYGVLYAFVLTLLAFDLMMSLEAHWYSTLFGAWYFMGSFYTGLAALIILLHIGIRSMGMGPFLRNRQFLGIGQLLLGFCLITGDFFFTQILIIWYGNIPEETRYVLTRMRENPWPPLSVAAILSCYLVPFGVLLSRRIKMKAAPMVLLSILILAGIWMERTMLVAPAIWKEGRLPLGLTELLITGGFVGILFLCVLFFLSRFPVLPVQDPGFLDLIDQQEEV